MFELLERLMHEPSKKRSLSRAVSKVLQGNSSYVESLAKQAGTQALLSENIFENFSEVDVKTYRDDDDLYKVALFVNFAQDYAAVDENLDMRVLAAAVSALKERNLELVVNDVNVNAQQARNGIIVKKHMEIPVSSLVR